MASVNFRIKFFCDSNISGFNPFNICFAKGVGSSGDEPDVHEL